MRATLCGMGLFSLLFILDIVRVSVAGVEVTPAEEVGLRAEFGVGVIGLLAAASLWKLYGRIGWSEPAK
jgi:hypothetical protein